MSLSAIVLRRSCAILGVAVTAVALMAQYGGSGDPWWEAGSGRSMPQFLSFPDPSGDVTVVNMDGPVATGDHPFFTAIGPNGRACITCHQPSNAMGLAVSQLRQQWKDSGGLDPVFAAVDGSNCPTLPQRDPGSHSLLLSRGLFRVYLPVPANAEFKIEVARDPTGCNTDPELGLSSPHPTISVFRRPRVVGNLKYVVASNDAFQPSAPYAALAADGRERTLAQQAADAMHAHEQAGRNLTAAELKQILDFESQVFTAQTSDNTGGDLTEVGGPLGAWSLGYGKLRASSTAKPQPIFLEASYWKSATATNSGSTPRNRFRESVARGNVIFTSRTFQISGVHGFALTATAGTCASCHDAPGSGSNLSQRAMDIGTTIVASPDAVPDLPVFKLTCNADAVPHPTAGRVIYTTDPGLALTTGKCADVGSIVMQQFRGLAARAPYFSNGSSQTLRDVVDFYDTRFNMQLSESEKQDLTNFLSVL